MFIVVRWCSLSFVAELVSGMGTKKLRPPAGWPQQVTPRDSLCGGAQGRFLPFR
jgi:hypothetical protein